MNRYHDPRAPAIAGDPYGDADAMHHFAISSGTQGAYTQRQTWEHDAGLVHHAYENNQRAIPGLGVGTDIHSQGAAIWSSSRVPSIQNQAPAGSGNIPLDTFSDDIGQPEATGTMQSNAIAEISDGELEDLYDPMVEDLPGSHDAPNDAENTVTSPPSYSPHMSPNHDASAPTNRPWSSDDLQKAREEARDAILRLWPLQVRYENYLENGIDRSLLQGLFQELGLAYEAPAQQVASDVPTTKPSHQATSTDTAEPESAAPTGEKSESRKDRIARLLAAKSSRPQAVQASVVSTNNMPVPEKPKQALGKSADKSKLLYEKMEALRKSREAKAEMAAKAKVQLDAHEASSESQISAPPHSSALQHVALTPRSTEAVHIEQGPRTATQKRPIASDFLSQQQEPVQKRPFSQTDNSRPFLIDVSEDEDSDEDTAMDIDSPEQRPSMLHRNDTEDLALRNYPSLSGLSSNGRSTPNAGPARGNGSHGKEDLDKMHRNIEEMKKRIAEAEARKRAKDSRQGTPHQGPTSSRSEGSVASPAAADVARDASTLAETPLASQSPVQLPGHSQSPLSKTHALETNESAKPQLRRSLSRAALDRLSVIEADRKRQTLKVKILRAQIAQMEKEMAASLEEEEALRAETKSPTPEPAVMNSLVTNANDPREANERGPASLEATQPVEQAVRHTGMLVSDNASGGRAKSPESTAEVDNSASTSSDEERAQASEELMATNKGAASDNDSETRNHAYAIPQETGDVESDSESTDMSSSESESDDDSEQDAGPTSEEHSQCNEPSSPAGHSPGSEVHDDSMMQENGAAVPSVVEAQAGADQQKGTVDSPRLEYSAPQGILADVETTDPCLVCPPSLTIKQDTQATQEHTSSDTASGSSFQPYESPLQYFHAFRFHPEYSKTVKGGLRSLTYSNKLDVRQQLCPDELLGQTCPRGADCDFQHLKTAATPDDHILMQLGSYGAHEGNQQQEFNKGLRKLLTEFRDQKVKDFHTISQAIIDYRAQFHQDRSRILPLGNVSL